MEKLPKNHFFHHSDISAINEFWFFQFPTEMLQLRQILFDRFVGNVKVSAEIIVTYCIQL